MADGYADGIADPEGAERGVDPSEIVVTTKRRALGRRWRHLSRERLKGKAARLPRGSRFFDLDPDEQASLTALVRDPEIRRLVLALGSAADGAEIRLLDAAYWIKGCSSLGRLRYAALVEVLGGDRPQLALLDVKEAVPHLAPAAAGIAVPPDHAERVVAGAGRCRPTSGTGWSPCHGDRAGGTPVTVREPLPQDLKIDAEQFSPRRGGPGSRPPRGDPGPGPRPPDGRGRPAELDRRRAGSDGAGPRRPRLALVGGHRLDGRAPARLLWSIAAGSPARRGTRPDARSPDTARRRPTRRARPRRGAHPPRRRLTPIPAIANTCAPAALARRTPGRPSDTMAVTRTYLDFEKPVAELEAKLEELRAVGARDGAVSIAEEVGRLEAKAWPGARRDLRESHALAEDPGGPPPAAAALRGLLRRAHHASSPLAGRRPQLRRGRGDPGRVRPVPRPAGPGARPGEGRYHRSAAAPQFRDGPARGLPQGGPAHGDRRPVRLSRSSPSWTPPAPIRASRRRSAARPRPSPAPTEACLALGVPNVAVVIGEGGSGGAIALATANRVLMLEHAIYGVISPEGAASILWRDQGRASDAATAMKITAQDLLRLGVIDGIIPEATGGAHRDREAAIRAAGRRRRRRPRPVRRPLARRGPRPARGEVPGDRPDPVSEPGATGACSGALGRLLGRRDAREPGRPQPRLPRLQLPDGARPQDARPAPVVGARSTGSSPCPAWPGTVSPTTSPRSSTGASWRASRRPSGAAPASGAGATALYRERHGLECVFNHHDPATSEADYAFP